MKFFLLFAFFSLFLTMIFNLFGFSIFIPYNRAIHYSFIAMCPFTAVGLNFILKKYLKKDYLKYLVLLVLFFILVSSNYTLDKTYKNYQAKLWQKRAF